MSHELHKLAEDLENRAVKDEICFDSNEMDLFARFSEAAKWAGRYSFPSGEQNVVNGKWKIPRISPKDGIDDRKDCEKLLMKLHRMLVTA